jgi:hypothetical protein
LSALALVLLPSTGSVYATVLAVCTQCDNLQPSYHSHVHLDCRPAAALQAVERTKQRLQAAALEQQHLEADLAAAQQRQHEGVASQQQPTVQLH